MSLEVLVCPRCGAVLSENTENCRHCGSLLVDNEAAPDSSSETSAPAQPTPPPLDLHGVDFGFDNQLFLHGLLALTVVFVAIGWMLEHPGTYWSSDAACIIWIAGPLIWCTVVAILWKGRAPFAWVAAMWGTSAFLLGLMQHNVRLNDDALGLSAVVGGGALLGFVIGRVIKKRWLVQRATVAELDCADLDPKTPERDS